MVLAPGMSDSSTSPGDALARVFVSAAQTTRMLPQEVRVRNQRLKESISPLMDSLGVAVRVAKRLSAADEAQAHLLGFLQGGVGGR